MLDKPASDLNCEASEGCRVGVGVHASIAETSDIGSAVAAILSDEAGWINGQRIEASGGMML